MHSQRKRHGWRVRCCGRWTGTAGCGGCGIAVRPEKPLWSSRPGVGLASRLLGRLAVFAAVLRRVPDGSGRRLAFCPCWTPPPLWSTLLGMRRLPLKPWERRILLYLLGIWTGAVLMLLFGWRPAWWWRWW